MNRLMLSTAALAVVMGLGTVSASAENISPPVPGVPVYGELRATPPTNFPPPGEAPAGFHYEWLYGYDHHAVYKGHWEPVRNS